jgi:hypothetical protein
MPVRRLLPRADGRNPDLVPVLLPVVQQLGIDPVHFGLVMVLNLMIGLLHPPMGMVLFVLARVANSVDREDDDGDRAVAHPAAAVAAADHVRAADLAVAPAHADALADGQRRWIASSASKSCRST